MAAERVAAEQDHVDRQDDRAEPYPEAHGAGGRIGEPQRLPHVGRQEDDEDQAEIQEVSVDVLDDQRERALAPVALARLPDRA